MWETHNFEAAYDFQIQSSFDTVTNLFKRSLFNAAYVKLKKMKLDYYEASVYSSENLNVNEKINYWSKPLMARNSRQFFHACTYNLGYAAFVVTACDVRQESRIWFLIQSLKELGP